MPARHGLAALILALLGVSAGNDGSAWAVGAGGREVNEAAEERDVLEQRAWVARDTYVGAHRDRN